MNAYETQLRESLNEMLAGYLDPNVQEDAAMLGGLADFVGQETRQSFINGLRKGRAGGGNGNRPNGALANGRIKPAKRQREEA